VKLARGKVAGRSEPMWLVVEEGTYLEVVGDPLGTWELGDRTFTAADVQLLAPVAPSKIVCIGRNYAEHAKELGNDVPARPVFFLKPTSSIQAPGAPILRPVGQSDEVHHEGELAVVVGRRLSRATRAEAAAAIFGFTCANDVTARDLQRADKHFTRAKGFDTFCPLGPVVVGVEDLADPQDVSLTVRVNGVVKQQARTRDMVFPIDLLLAWVSSVMTLLPGDVLLTGTPSGVGPLAAGDVVDVEIEGIGVLSSPVEDGPAAPGLF
jgi:2-keto-4-pentenoate hydratase/2-oxohepta-3-ene-1,7-dioic acid hydratase in catechol pathway